MTRQRILIIEEDGGRADELSVEFDRDGHETLIARNSEEGVRLARGVLPDRIIVDMPIADCLELCWRLGDLESTAARFRSSCSPRTPPPSPPQTPRSRSMSRQRDWRRAIRSLCV